MKGHPNSRFQKLTSASLEAAIGELSLSDRCDQNDTSDQHPFTDQTSSDEAHCFILSSDDIERVDASIAERGLKS